MAETHELAVRDKKELVSKEEKTVPGRYYVPYADIYETDDALSVVMEMAGVEKDNVSVALENDVLRVEGQIDFTKYEGMEPVYTEYNVGPLRTFVRPLEQDRPREDQRPTRGWGADLDAAEGEASSASADRDRVIRGACAGGGAAVRASAVEGAKGICRRRRLECCRLVAAPVGAESIVDRRFAISRGDGGSGADAAVRERPSASRHLHAGTRRLVKPPVFEPAPASQFFNSGLSDLAAAKSPWRCNATPLH